MKIIYLEIVIQKSTAMEKNFNYLKNNQRDYKKSLKLQIIEKKERTELSAM